MGVMCRSKSTTKKRAKFLRLLEQTGNVSKASLLSCLGRRYLYHYRENDERFAAAWDAAIEKSMDVLEEEARRRAFNGTPEPVFYQGSVCGTVLRYSDSLLMFLLKGGKPDKYADRKQVSGPGGGPIESKQEIRQTVVEEVPYDEMLRIAQKMRELTSNGHEISQQPLATD
jgi:hypothetical protein